MFWTTISDDVSLGNLTARKKNEELMRNSMSLASYKTSLPRREHQQETEILPYDAAFGYTGRAGRDALPRYR
ncbi:hypothetical protein E2C01_007671 [Portunus trituberculatus]|uniref:Uncharacterized protein n=1 Tax=Portunus trituberculatus TaxID=210409 RepID=A0A5B7D4N5_PORTR|nr:hypothetical protein [Portunus trituberculatus]